MTILSIRTDKAEAELGLYDDAKEIAYLKWQAHLELSKTIHEKIANMLNKSSIPLDGIEGIVCYSGTGSFTGLRIGLSVANALAYAEDIPIVGKDGKDWIQTGIKALLEGQNDKIVIPNYGSPALTTKPRK